MKGLLILPAHNEAQNLVHVIQDITLHCKNVDYVIIDDGSTDNTQRICEENNLNAVHLSVNVGLADAVQTGMRYAYQRGYDFALQFDADGQHLARYVAALSAEIEAGYDIVIGSRFATQKKPKSLRMLGSNIIGLAVLLTTGKLIHDPTSGMRMYSKKIIERLALRINYGPEPDTLALLIRSGASVREVQVEMDERWAGESYFNLVSSAKYMLHMCISILFVQWFRKERG